MTHIDAYEELERRDTLLPPTLPSSRGPDAVRVPRRFDTGATRDTDVDKLDYEGFEHPSVMRRFAEYMHENRRMRDGSFRDSDNWQKGIPITQYMKSLLRHTFEVWAWVRGDNTIDIERALCAVRFNVNGMLFEILGSRERR